MANVRDINDFVEQLSNCVGHITGDEVVFKKAAYSSEYDVRMRNHNIRVANIWYDYDKDKIIVQLVPAFRNMEYSLDDLTIENIKDIGQLVRKNALNRIGESMELEVAEKILNENGFGIFKRKPKVDQRALLLKMAVRLQEQYNSLIEDYYPEALDKTDLSNYTEEELREYISYKESDIRRFRHELYKNKNQ